MRGEFIGVWAETSREIWEKLADEETAPDDIYCELYRELSSVLKKKPTPEELANIIDNSVKAKDAFWNTKAEDFAGERTLVDFFEKTHEALDDLVGDALANPYFNLLNTFIEKFSLRYDLRRPCQLCPTLPGVFTSLVRELRTLTASDAHLDSLMKEFESAIRDLRADNSEGKIKTCIQKQVNLLEALGRNCPGVTRNTLGKICDQLGSWPHADVKKAMKDLYGFSCDYPGIRHGGTPANALRAVDMRDMVALSVLLTGFTPYLGNNLNADAIFGGGLAQVKPITPSAAFQPPPTTPTSTRRKPRTFIAGIYAWCKDQLLGQN
jgi:hypothetical protein